ncbi:MAG: hypothetical protein M3367_10950 [Acidobacteriota bacterium]|nr:hypothetical protein [Acidobacteriota bacterium]
MFEADVERIFQYPFTMIATDADVVKLVGESTSHPRVFGNNARVLLTSLFLTPTPLSTEPLFKNRNNTPSGLITSSSTKKND